MCLQLYKALTCCTRGPQHLCSVQEVHQSQAVFVPYVKGWGQGSCTKRRLCVCADVDCKPSAV